MQKFNFSFDTVLNTLSFGNVSFAILRELKNRGIQPNIFTGQIDNSAQKPDQELDSYISNLTGSAQKYHSRDNKCIKLWHINGSLQSYSSLGNDLITFFELDQLTPTEVNVLKNQRKVYVTSLYTQNIFKNYGVESVYLPLGFDSQNFSKIDNKKKIEGEVSFLMAGKLERRKGHFDILKLWAKKFGNKLGYKLNCAITNPFLNQDQFNNLINQILGGVRYWNINFIPWSKTNAEYNSVLQSSDIIFALSGAEGFDLPVYHATALGVWPLALRAHVYTDYLNDKNAIFINHNGKKPAYDNMFFAQNQPFNQGNIFSFSEEEFNSGCERAIQKVKESPVNIFGLDLQKQTYKQTVDILLENLNK